MAELPTIAALPRVDCITTAVDTGDPRRLTIYSGTITAGPPPSILGSQVSFGEGVGGRMVYQGPLWVPDSLPYRRDRLADSVAALQLGMLVAGGDAPSGVQGSAYFAADPRGGDNSWLQITLDAHLRAGMVTSYQIVVLAPTAAIAPS
jgi:hypothetical protein